jgi:hypothetical protein
MANSFAPFPFTTLATILSLQEKNELILLVIQYFIAAHRLIRQLFA